MARLAIYGDRISGNCMKVLWAAQRAGLDLDWIDVDILAGETRTEEFLALNPFGQVPVARFEDGRALAQSNAIVLHIAETAGGDLLPEIAFDRAKVYEWLFWEQYSHETAIAVRRFQKLYLKKADANIPADLLAKGRRALGRMEMALQGTDYLVGGRFTAADLSLLAYTRLAHEGGFDLGEFPAVRGWVRRAERELDLPHALDLEEAI